MNAFAVTRGLELQCSALTKGTLRDRSIGKVDTPNGQRLYVERFKLWHNKNQFRIDCVCYCAESCLLATLSFVSGVPFLGWPSSPAFYVEFVGRCHSPTWVKWKWKKISVNFARPTITSTTTSYMSTIRCYMSSQRTFVPC